MSSLYRAMFWRVGQVGAKWLSADAGVRLCRMLVDAYFRMLPRRREILIQNLLPVLGDDRVAATQAAQEMTGHFARKLVDLWRFEGGLPMAGLVEEGQGFSFLEAARARRRGVLLLTPHLGNWELGGALLAAHAIPLQVITQAEPGKNFTALRQNARARWGIETIVLGANPYAYLEIVGRLKSGATMALLIDRPPETGGVTVQLFGRPFQVSAVAAELARVSGAALIPICLCRKADRYYLYALPEIPYAAAALEAPAARIELMQRIVRTFEPAIREHANQWYHFAPVWPRARMP